MKLNVQKRIAAAVLDCSPKRVVFSEEHLGDIKEAITKNDLRNLIKNGAIQSRPELRTSRVRARKRLTQRRKGRQAGPGTRKGSSTARLSRKETWMLAVRGQRNFIKELKDKSLVEGKTYRNLYSKVKGGYFRNRRHIKLYLEENKLFIEKVKK